MHYTLVLKFRKKGLMKNEKEMEYKMYDMVKIYIENY